MRFNFKRTISVYSKPFHELQDKEGLNIKALLMMYIAGHFVIAGRVGGAEQMFYNLLEGFKANRTSFIVLCSDLKDFNPAFIKHLNATGTPIVANNVRQKRFIAEQTSCLTAKTRAEAILFPNYSHRRLFLDASGGWQQSFRIFCSPSGRASCHESAESGNGCPIDIPMPVPMS